MKNSYTSQGRFGRSIRHTSRLGRKEGSRANLVKLALKETALKVKQALGVGPCVVRTDSDGNVWKSVGGHAWVLVDADETPFGN